MGARGWGSRARLFALLCVLLALLPQATALATDTVDDTSTAWIGDTGQSGNPMVFGIASHAWWLDPDAYGDQLFPALDDLQATNVRLSIDWRRFEPTEGTYDWGMYDRVFDELAKRNIVIVLDFNTIPAWASTDEAGCADPKLEIYACELREDKYPAFQNAIRAAVTRYAWIDYWEFWNEPEMWRYLGQDGTVYLRHLKTFYDIAHRSTRRSPSRPRRWSARSTWTTSGTLATPPTAWATSRGMQCRSTRTTGITSTRRASSISRSTTTASARCTTCC